MTTMIENVARAMNAALIAEAERNGEWMDDGFGINGDEVKYDGNFSITVLARAAIEAMREPTDAMVVNGDEKIIEFLNDHSFAIRPTTPAQASYTAMIDAALTEKEPAE